LVAQFGEIIECRVLKERNALQSKGVAFVQFNLKSQANNGTSREPSIDPLRAAPASLVPPRIVSLACVSPALSLNGYRPPGSDRLLVVKYAEDQHKKKERRVQMEMGMMGMMGMSGMPVGGVAGLGGLGGMMPLPRGPSEGLDFFARQRSAGLAGMYPDQRGSAAMGMGSPVSLANHLYMQSSLYPSPPPGSRKGVGGYGAGSTMDWFQPPMPQMMYDPQLASAAGMGMHGGVDMYDQLAMEQMRTMAAAQARGGPSSSYGRSARGGAPSGNAAAAAAGAGTYTGTVTILVQNLPYNADVPLLHDLFAPYGRIVGEQIEETEAGRDPSDPNYAYSGRGRVHMQGLAQAQYAARGVARALAALRVPSTGPACVLVRARY
jgi:hypothetical protein